MPKRIVYVTDDGSVNVIVPAPDALAALGVEAIALKDVPAGKPYKIVDTETLPSDRTFRGAWEVDEALLTDGVGANYGVGSNLEVVGWNEDGAPVTKEATQ